MTEERILTLMTNGDNLLPGGKAEALQIGGMYQNKTLPPLVSN
jgi:hypothetical protein